MSNDNLVVEAVALPAVCEKQFTFVIAYPAGKYFSKETKLRFI